MLIILHKNFGNRLYFIDMSKGYTNSSITPSQIIYEFQSFFINVANERGFQAFHFKLRRKRPVNPILTFNYGINFLVNRHHCKDFNRLIEFTCFVCEYQLISKCINFILYCIRKQTGLPVFRYTFFLKERHYFA